MSQDLRRVNVLVTDNYQHAASVTEFLRESDIDVKMVTKYAVQVLSSQLQTVTALNADYSAWVERRNAEAKQCGRAA